MDSDSRYELLKDHLANGTPVNDDCDDTDWLALLLQDEPVENPDEGLGPLADPSLLVQGVATRSEEKMAVLTHLVSIICRVKKRLKRLKKMENEIKACLEMGCSCVVVSECWNVCIVGIDQRL